MFYRMLVVCAFAVLIPAAALAQTRMITTAGPRVGLSLDPDQVVFGGQLAVGEIAPDLTFDPNLELGFGDNCQVVALNLDLHYHFAVAGTRWSPYAGGGLGLNFIEVDVEAPVRDRSSTEVGGNLILGAGIPTRAGNRFFGEVKFGLGDIPSLKLLVGWNFKL
jgi:hypothetical protein